MIKEPKRVAGKTVFLELTMRSAGSAPAAGLLLAMAILLVTAPARADSHNSAYCKTSPWYCMGWTVTIHGTLTGFNPFDVTGGRDGDDGDDTDEWTSTDRERTEREVIVEEMNEPCLSG